MGSNSGFEHTLRQEVGLGILPLPLIIQELGLLTLPVCELTDMIISRLADNPLFEVAPSGNIAADWDLELSSPVELADELTGQLVRHPLAADLIPWLDPRGFLSGREDEIAEYIGVDERSLEEALEGIRAEVVPPGLFARNLVHCLLIQLERRGLVEGDGAALLKAAGSLLASGDMKGAAETMGWNERRLGAALRELAQLDPSPGKTALSPPVIPEVALFPGDGRVAVFLENCLPKISLTPLDWEDRRVEELREQGIRLIRDLARRKATKIKLAMAIAKRQRPYLTGTTSAPGPVTLAELAEETERAISTVQRTAASTWAETPRGTLLLETLFSRPLRSRPDMSVAQVREAIKEARSTGMSDRDLSKKMNIPLRTISWHRKKTRPQRFFSQALDILWKENESR